jgi:cold shock CspA family protein
MKQFGTVNSFNEASGHGSIRPNNGGSDLGFETSDLSFIGFNSPKVGQRMSYHVSGKHGHASAVDVRQTLSIATVTDRPLFTVFRSAAEKASTDVGKVCGRDLPTLRY